MSKIKQTFEVEQEYSTIVKFQCPIRGEVEQIVMVKKYSTKPIKED